MKHFILTVCALIACVTLAAQDIIVTTAAQKIEAKILEVSKSEIKYKEIDNLEGPTFVLETNEINSIIYSNGKVVLYDSQSANTPSNSVADEDIVEILLLSGVKFKAQITEMKSDYIAYVLDGNPYTLSTSQIDQVTFLQNGQVKKYNHYSSVENVSSSTPDANNNTKATPDDKSEACYQGYFDVAGYVGKEEYQIISVTVGGFGIEGIDGVRFNKYLFTGIGIGLHTLFLNYLGASAMTLQTPLFADLRVYLPTKNNGLYPYLETSLGPMFQYYQRASYKGYSTSTTNFNIFAYFKLNAGIDINHLSIGLGYSLVGNKDGVDNFFFAKIGVRIGQFSK